MMIRSLNIWKLVEILWVMELTHYLVATIHSLMSSIQTHIQDCLLSMKYF